MKILVLIICFISNPTVIISLIALGFSIYTYCKHDKKLNKQQKLINDFKLKEKQEKEDDKKKAIIEIDCKPISNQYYNKYQIIIKNQGHSEARNVLIHFPEKIEEILHKSPDNQPRKISPNSTYKFEIESQDLFPESEDIRVSWDDDFENNREKKTHIYFS